MIERKIDPLGRIVIPMEIRNSLGIKPNTPLMISVEGDIISLRKPENVCRLCGSTDQINPELHICQACKDQIKAL